MSLKDITVIGFVGPSGTGKSHKALQIANAMGIEHFIDDGLLIKGNSVLAGSSAKKEKTRIAAVKRALFVTEDHANAIKTEIERRQPKILLILGTSDAMVESIAKRLNLPNISKTIYIHDVSEKDEIEVALNIRKSQGKHVIPVPTFEIKKEFSGYFLDPLQIFRRRGKDKMQLISEKSVVRPTFSYMGKYSISDYAVYQIVEYTVMGIEGVDRISRFKVENGDSGITVDMDVIFRYGFSVINLLETIRERVKTEIEYITALNITALNITVKSLVVDN